MIAKVRTVLGHGQLGALACGIMLPLAALATPTITVDRVQQRYPWNNVVDIDYTISGMTGDPYDYRVELSVSSTALADPVIASNFVNCAWCDLTTSNGTWRASWNAKADGVNFLDANARLLSRPTDGYARRRARAGRAHAHRAHYRRLGDLPALIVW